MKRPRANQLVAIVGGSGAGKGWLANRLQKLLGEHACRVAQDDFYVDQSHLPPSRREQVNYDAPDAIDWDCLDVVLHDCRTGRTTRMPRYDFITHTRLSDRVAWEPKPLVLVDGLWLLLHPRIRRLFDLKIFMDCPERIRLRRRLLRDTAERGRKPETVREQFRSTVAPMHKHHVEPQKRWADVVLCHPCRDSDLTALADRLWIALQTSSLLPDWMRATFRAELLALMNDESPEN
jgi:uridine kinase